MARFRLNAGRYVGRLGKRSGGWIRAPSNAALPDHMGSSRHRGAFILARCRGKNAMHEMTAETATKLFWLLSGFRVVRLGHATKAATRAPSRALPRRRALCTNWKKPR